MDQDVRRGLNPLRLVAGAIAGAVVAAIVIALAGAGGAWAVILTGVVLTVVFGAAWIVSVRYLRTPRGRAAAEEYRARRRR